MHQDAKDSSRYVFDLVQAGLGLPDRDYYLQNDERLKQIRTQYGEHIVRMLTLAGDGSAAPQEAARIMALETALANVQWTRVTNRDPVKVYNKYGLRELAPLTPCLLYTSRCV